MHKMMIKIAKSQDEKDQLDELLWGVLWKPLNLQRNIRTEFELPGEEIELVAVYNKRIVGALVANWTGENKLEIRHLAVDENCQGKSVGTGLISKLFDLINKNNPVKVQVYARSTSYPFFVKLGFAPATEEWIDHPDFKKHGIRFMLVEKYI